MPCDLLSPLSLVPGSAGLLRPPPPTDGRSPRPPQPAPHLTPAWGLRHPPLLLRPCSGRPVFSCPWWLPLSEHVSSCPVCVPGRSPRVPSAAACAPAAPDRAAPPLHPHLAWVFRGLRLTAPCPPPPRAAGPQATLHHVPSLCMQAQRPNLAACLDASLNSFPSPAAAIPSVPEFVHPCP